MAFKILSADEIELLTENHRAQYENELAVYNERVKFVEQMEKFENTVLEPYEPKLKYISVIGEAPEKEFAIPEYIVKTTEPIVRPEPKVAAVNFDQPITAKVPQYAKTENVPVDHIKKAEQGIPVLPQIIKATAPSKQYDKPENKAPVLPKTAKTSVPNKIFKKSEQDKPKLPAATKPQTFEEFAFAPVTIDSEAIKASRRDTATPKIDAPAFTAPEKAQPVLPKTAKASVPNKIFKKSEQAKPKLPAATKPQTFAELVFAPVAIDGEAIKASRRGAITPKIEAPAFAAPEKAQPVLPNTAVGFLDVKVYEKPELSKLELTVNVKTNIPTSQFKKTDRTLSELPVVDAVKIGTQSYTAPEIKKTDLPAFVKPAAVSNPEFKQPSGSTPQIEYPSINIKPVKTFEKVTGKVSGVPEVNAVTIPDAYANESLKNLLPTKKETKTTGGEIA